MSIVAVAKRAGVSVATVSRVINDMGSVRSRTADQVREAMREMGYTPPAVRRGPKARRPDRTLTTIQQIAILNIGGGPGWLHLPVMGSVVSGVVRVCKAAGITPVLDEMPDPLQLSSVISEGKVDAAIVFLHSGADVSCLEAIRRYMPVVRVTGDASAQVCDHVTAHNAAIGALAQRYLHGKGCRKVGFITDRPDLQLMRTRGNSFNSLSLDSGMENRSFIVGERQTDLLAYAGRVTLFASLQSAVDEIVKCGLDGLFIPTDLLTTQLYPMFERVGIRPCKDLAIISCDNEQVRLSTLSPRPPSIDLRSEEIGWMAVNTLKDRVANPNQPRISVLVSPTLSLPGE